MLDTETKRRIDTCRDILVGKVPDPKSQVEQITIALIYKFMDDMDAEAEELGGDRNFFAGEYAKYGWAKLMAPNMGGFDVLALYSEGIQKMNQNRGIPLLFRDIFKNAYLPYRDPETLRIFLKEINSFKYDHSERLGDAFEYLLSVLGSQGDAGQFRTPRHLIDFMVDIIDPKKDEVILDPACGTAGFLISAYKHILKQNSSNKPSEKTDAVSETASVYAAVETLALLAVDNPLHYKGDLLTPDERRRIVANIMGYDISPDMVRLSLVNLYLHGFANPHIDEYDTLTSDERWNEYADIILANPPFMSPKGGIKPHKRFTIQAKRSEVLFVDYIIEHLSPNGRAAIIVPEGIIFQSGTAYKSLRKLLVETCLVAVISLPAGVFNPYSGVKTSILVLDKRLAKKTDTILFAKIENDGFNLGAQRRRIEQNDLPEVGRHIKSWMQNLRSDRVLILDGIPNLHQVEKAWIGENGEWGLSGERYANAGNPQQKVFQNVTIEQAVDRISDSFNPTNVDGYVTYIGLENIESYTGKLVGSLTSSYSSIKSLKSKFTTDDILYGKLRPNLNKVHLASVDGICSTDIFVLRTKENADPRYISAVMRSPQFNFEVLKGLGGAQMPRVGFEHLRLLNIPLPPLDVQKEIAVEIEGYQKIIDGARQVVENYQPRISIQPNWPMVELGTICENLDSRRVPITKEVRKEGPYPYYGASGIVDYVESYIFDEDLLLISEDGANLLARGTPIAFSISGKVWVNNHAHVLRFPDMATQKFVETYINSISIENYVTGAAQPKLNQQALNSIKLPLPDLDTQRAIVAQIAEEQRLVNANKELIRLFEAKIKATIHRVWGEAD